MWFLFRETGASISATSFYNKVIALGGRQNSPPGQNGGGDTSSNMRFDLLNAMTNMPNSWMTTYMQWQKILLYERVVRALILASYWVNVRKACFSFLVLAVTDHRQDLRIHSSKVVTSLSSYTSLYIWWNISKWYLKFRWRDHTHLII